MSIGKHLTRVNLIMEKRIWRLIKVDAAISGLSSSKLINLIVQAYLDEEDPRVRRAFDTWLKKYAKKMEGCVAIVRMDDE